MDKLEIWVRAFFVALHAIACIVSMIFAVWSAFKHEWELVAVFFIIAFGLASFTINRYKALKFMLKLQDH